jgi:hypothetical protein
VLCDTIIQQKKSQYDSNHIRIYEQHYGSNHNFVSFKIYDFKTCINLATAPTKVARAKINSGSDNIGLTL